MWCYGGGWFCNLELVGWLVPDLVVKRIVVRWRQDHAGVWVGVGSTFPVL